MTVQIISGQHVLFGGYRITCQTNAIGESMQTAVLDATTLCSGGTEINEPGLKGYGQSVEGFWDAPSDAYLFDRQRERNVVSTLCLTDGSVGSPCRTVRAMVSEHAIGDAEVGSLLPFSYTLGSMDSPQMGVILHNGSAAGNVTGTAVQAGQATGTIYGALHVFSGTGSFVVTIQSASTSGFGSPTTRITFATVATGVPTTYEWAVASVTTTNEWWRVTATNPNTRDFAVALAL
jgi:hypothetical protein